jgi:hypothetical protein
MQRLATGATGIIPTGPTEQFTEATETCYVKDKHILPTGRNLAIPFGWKPVDLQQPDMWIPR